MQIKSGGIFWAGALALCVAKSALFGSDAKREICHRALSERVSPRISYRASRELRDHARWDEDANGIANLMRAALEVEAPVGLFMEWAAHRDVLTRNVLAHYFGSSRNFGDRTLELVSRALASATGFTAMRVLYTLHRDQLRAKHIAPDMLNQLAHSRAREDGDPKFDGDLMAAKLLRRMPDRDFWRWAIRVAHSPYLPPAFRRVLRRGLRFYATERLERDDRITDLLLDLDLLTEHLRHLEVRVAP